MIQYNDNGDMLATFDTRGKNPLSSTTRLFIKEDYVDAYYYEGKKIEITRSAGVSKQQFDMFLENVFYYGVEVSKAEWEIILRELETKTPNTFGLLTEEILYFNTTFRPEIYVPSRALRVSYMMLHTILLETNKTYKKLNFEFKLEHGGN